MIQMRFGNLLLHIAPGRNLGDEGTQRKPAGEPCRVADEADPGAAEAARVAQRGA